MESTAVTIENDTNTVDMVQLLNNDEAQKEFQEASASISLNPAVSWVKFVLTDDQPNKNKQRIPQEEFGNLIRTGIFMPLKMAKGAIKDGHDGAEPIGVITHLKQVGNQILGLAALWSKEREADIASLKALASKNSPINLSWEILYGQSETSDDGVESLHDTSLRATTIVGMPAYGGRTPILAVAAKFSPAYLSKLSDESFLYVEVGERKYPYRDLDGNLDVEELNRIKSTPTAIDENLRDTILAKVDSLLLETHSEEGQSNSEDINLDKIEELEAKVSELETKLADATKQLEDKQTEATSVSDELNSLREFKSAIELKEANSAKLAEIQKKFSEAGVIKEESYFKDNAENLLKLDTAALDFMIQEIVAFSNKPEKVEETASTKIPNLQSASKKMTISEIATALRQGK